MSPELLQQHWALVGASVIGLAVVLMLAMRAVLGSSRAQLNARVVELREREREGRKAARAVGKAAKKLERLQRKADSVKPRLIEEAAGELEDARMLQKIADDQVLIAKNQVRQIIVEEFPPKRHEDLRKRLLPNEKSETRPFTMEGG
jgi:hypothetical protein